MNRFATLGRCIFCYPAPLPPHEEDIEEDVFERNVRRFNEVFSWIDLINLILDCIFSLRLILDGWRNEGLTLLGGTGLAYISAHLGKRLVNEKGLEWAPFCQSSRTYYPSTGRRESKLRILFALAFAELAIFMFEDVTTILVFLQTGPTDVDWLDTVNLFTTFLSALVAITLLLCTLLYSIHCSCPTTSLLALTTAVICRGMLTLLFLALFLIVMIIVSIAIVLTGLFIFQRGVFPNRDMETTPFGLSVTIMWLIGFYFLHKIVRGRIQRGSDATDESKSTHSVDNESDTRREKARSNMNSIV